MNIKFTDNKAGHHYTDAKVAIWKLYVKEFTRKIVLQYASGLLFLIIGIATFNHSVWRSVSDNSTKELNFHFFFIVGIVWLYITAVKHLRLAKQKEKYMKRIADSAVRRFGRSNAEAIVINDNGVLIHSDELKSKTSWTLITHFKLVDDLIFLIPDENIDAAISINKSLLSTQEYQQLLTFLQTSKKRMDKIS